jgi:hypothetical protein
LEISVLVAEEELIFSFIDGHLIGHSFKLKGSDWGVALGAEFESLWLSLDATI